MIAHSNAYVSLRDKSQEFIDFVVLACTAVPTLSASLAAGGQQGLSRDHFKGQINVAQLQQYAGIYQDPLSRMVVFSMFSYFEAYVTALLSEIVDFHGGESTFQATAERRAKAFIAATSPAIANSKRKLQEPAKAKDKEKYQKHSAVLVKSGYRFPSELLAPYGVKNLIQKAKPKGSKAFELEVLIRDALCFPLSATDAKRLTDIRNIRNDIAHGKPKPLTLKDALAIATDLRNLAVKVDRHAVEHFFVLESYA